MDNLRDYLLNINEINEYLDALFKIKDNITIVISVRDTPGSNMPDEVLNKFKELGFGKLSTELWRMYAGILHNGSIILDYTANEPEEKIEVDVNIENVPIHILSAPWRNGDRASILIDKIDYACNRRGVNIVAYDIETDTPLDSVYFDSHGKQYMFSRGKKILEKKRWLENGKKYDVCVVGVWYGANYGSLLNGYATYLLLKELGKSVVMLRKPDHLTDDNELQEWTHNTNFINSVYPKDDISPRMNYEDIELINNHVETFIAGSDQIWNYNVSFSGFMFLPFVEATKRRISFCTSFGQKNDNVPNDKVKFVSNEFHKFDAISVRENFGKKILDKKYGVGATVLLEPVFDIDRSIYDNLICQSTFNEQESYIIAYILDPTDEKLDIVKTVAEKNNCKIITIPDGCYTIVESSWDTYQRKAEFPNLQVNMDARDFLNAFSKSQFVVTDSFHGTCFSIIFEKRFISLCNDERGADRFDEILGRFNLLNRLIIDTKEFIWEDKYLEYINYEEINRIIECGRAEAVEWLKKVLNTPKEELPSVLIPEKAVTSQLDKKQCMGCGACISVCPKGALSLKQDEMGYYRSTIDYDKCINCGLCSGVCSALELPEKNNAKVPTCYAFVASDKKLLYHSSSGGIFPLLAHQALQRDGVVAGAAWRNDFSVEHIIIDDENDLHKLQKSKYLQSYLGDTCKKVKQKLESGKFVLFSGCPCQVAGLNKYLKRDYDNLITVDLFCGNSPSTKFFQNYLKDEYPQGVQKYEFRYKGQGWNADSLTLTLKDGTTMVKRGGMEDSYQRVYHNHTMCAYHCENCKYQEAPRFGDITIGDFWGIGNKDTTLDTNGGVSAILCNNAKGSAFLESIPEEKIGVKKQVPLDWIGGNGYVINNSHNYCSPKRNVFYDVVTRMPFMEAVDYALKPNHGKYNQVYKTSNTPLLFDSSMNRFKFDPEIWEEHTINGLVTLMVKPEMAEVGKYAIMPLSKLLDREKEYQFTICFKVKTASNTINFHIKDSGSNYCQIIYSYRIPVEYKGEMIYLSFKFTPKANIFDEFMIGASQISGKDNYIAFDFINIVDLK